MEWWELGLVSRHVGYEFSPTHLHCPYCTNKGKYIRIFRSEKRGESSAQDHTSDVWRCQSCAEDLFIQWHTDKGMVDFRVFPQSMQHGMADVLPSDVNEEYQQALSAYVNENWDVCVVLLKRLIDLLAVERDIQSTNLFGIFEQLKAAGAITQDLVTWAQEIEALQPQHPAKIADQAAAREMLTFTRWLLDMLYLLPHSKKRYRSESP